MGGRVDDLVSRAKKGDAAAARALVERFWDRIFRYAVRLGCAPSDAEDLAQEVFLKVFRSLDSFATGTNFMAWLLRIATNCFIDGVRARASRPEAGAKAIDPETPAMENPDRAAEFREVERAADLAIGALPEPERTVLVLRVFEDLTHREIAGIVGKAEGTVRWYLCRARKNLRGSLSEFL